MTVFPVDSLGHPVFAVIPVDNMKRPLVAWKEYQTRLPTQEEKERWITQFDGAIAGWAMPTGQVSGIVALDFDGEEGMQTLLKLGLRPNVKTPGNGAHVWLEAPSHAVRTGAIDNTRWPSMELKGDGGYVVVVGEKIRSQHKDSATIIGNYTIIDGMPSVEGDLDTELARFVFQSKEVDTDYAIFRLIQEAIEKTKDGRNNAGFWLACELRDLGLSKTDTWAILEDNFYPEIPRGNHAYTKQELKLSLDSAFTREAAAKATATTVTLELFNQQTNVELWHTATRDAYVSVEGENFFLGSMESRDYVDGLYFDKAKKPLNTSSIEEVIRTLRRIALRDGAEYDIHMRVGYKDNRLYLDNENVEGLKFVRSSTMAPFSTPLSGQSVELLTKYLNIQLRDWPLIQGLILSHFMPDGPYPVGVFMGPQGSAKSMNQSFVLSVVDPRPNREAGRSRFPRDAQDLVVAAKHNRILSFDNVSSIPEWLSDTLCIFSTGGTIVKRELYTNDDIKTYTQKRPVLLNGIGDIVTRPDLLDRAIIFDCPPLDAYKNEDILWRSFVSDLPYILGAFKAMAQKALSNLESYSNVDDKDIRMVDFLHWGLAAEINGFLDAYRDNRNRGAEIAVGNSAVGRYMRDVAEKHRDEPTNPDLLDRLQVKDELKHGYYVGTMHKLYEEGEMMATGDYDWPKKFESFVNQVHRIEPMLSKLGIKIDKHRTNFMEFIFIGYRHES